MTPSTPSFESDDWLDNGEVKDILEDHLDKKDYRIFKALNENGRISDTELGEKVGLSRTAARRRRELIQEDGILDIMAVLVLQEADLAYADVRVKISSETSPEEMDEFIEDLLYEELIYEIDEYLGGQYDLLIRAWHSSLHDVKQYIANRLRGRTEVADYEVTPVVKTWKAWQKVIKNGDEG